MNNYSKFVPIIPFPIRKEYNNSIELAEARKKYREHINEQNMRFKKYLFTINNIVDNPKAELLWQKAWDYGHANGLYDVENNFNKLINLIL